MAEDNLENTLMLNIQFEKRGGLVPTVAQDYKTGQILMLGYVNEEALKKTLEINKATFWSTSRKELWTKGLTSGDFLEIVDILVDCDQDALIYKVNPVGGACHTKNEKRESRKTCFYRKIAYDNKLEFLEGMKYNVQRRKNKSRFTKGKFKHRGKRKYSQNFY
jgi:phosphoribosyl-AMP cyclohydrolase